MNSNIVTKHIRTVWLLLTYLAADDHLQNRWATIENSLYA